MSIVVQLISGMLAFSRQHFCYMWFWFKTPKNAYFTLAILAAAFFLFMFVLKLHWLASLGLSVFLILSVVGRVVGVKALDKYRKEREL